MDDLISKAAAVGIIADMHGLCRDDVLRESIQAIKELPAIDTAPMVMVDTELTDTELIEKIRKAPIVMKPIVDAAPVAHGQWLGRRYDFKEYKYVIVPYDATTFDNPDDLFCSVCNTPALLNGAENDVPSNYCPHCGARMDGERRDSE